MKNLRTMLGMVLTALTLVTPIPARADDAPKLELEASISLGDVQGRIDHLAYDPGRRRLYVAELGNDSVGIVDLGTRHLLRTVKGFEEPQGIAYEPSTDTVYVANGGDGSVQLFGGSDFAPIGKIALGSDADNVRVDPQAKRVYVGYGNGAIAVIDASTRKRIGDIQVGGHPEGFQVDSAGSKMFVNVPDLRAIVVAPLTSGTSIVRWLMSDLRANYPLALDASNKRVLAAFRNPARLEAFDVSTGDRLGGSDACGDADDVFIDTKRERIYVVCGAGSVDTYVLADATFARTERFETRAGSRTGILLPDLDRLAVAVRASGTEPAAVWVLRPQEDARPAQILMVCEHGNVKSLMAASYFNQLAKARRLPFVAVSRGVAPDSTTVPAAIIEGLRADGFDVSSFHPTTLAASDVTAAHRVVLISTELPSGIPAGARQPERWIDVPPASTNYAAAREALKARVRALLNELSGEEKRP